jgi:hypothetical protein
MMQKVSQSELKGMLTEASLALAYLDAERLEEMALSCAALVRGPEWEPCYSKNQWKPGSGKAMEEMAIFARVLEATKVNLKVMHNLCEARAAHLEYGPTHAGASALEESEHGDH